MNDAEEKKGLTVLVPDKLRQKIKVIAQSRRQSMSGFAELALEQAVKRIESEMKPEKGE